jgi:CBS domain-containing protein
MVFPSTQRAVKIAGAEVFTLVQRDRSGGVASRPSEGAMNIGSLLAKKGVTVITARPEATIREALGLLADHNIGAIVVKGDGERPVGVMSERDVVRALARDEKVLAQPISTIMTREVVVGSPQDDLLTVGHTMTERRIRHLPVMEGGKLVGIVSIGDVVKAQRDEFQGEAETLQVQLLGTGA